MIKKMRPPAQADIYAGGYRDERLCDYSEQYSGSAEEWLEERNVPIVPLKYTIDGETYTDMEGLSAKNFLQTS